MHVFLNDIFHFYKKMRLWPGGGWEVIPILGLSDHVTKNIQWKYRYSGKCKRKSWTWIQNINTTKRRAELLSLYSQIHIKGFLAPYFLHLRSAPAISNGWLVYSEEHVLKIKSDKLQTQIYVLRSESKRYLRSCSPGIKIKTILYYINKYPHLSTILYGNLFSSDFAGGWARLGFFPTKNFIFKFGFLGKI